MARAQIASLVLMLSVRITCAAPPCRAHEPGPGWPVVGGSQGGGHFTPLAQITAENVSELHEEWVYHTGDFSPGAPGHRATTFEATPILANAMLYFCTPYITG
jgi:quinoprotein glucose dehydrogenase